MNELIEHRIAQVKQTIETIDKVFAEREYSGKEVRDFLRIAQRLIECGELRFGSEEEVTHFPETMPLIVEVILSYTRAVRKIELNNLESWLAKSQARMNGEQV
jgi:uncharacterized coiled-coil protein SlyX